MQVWLKSHVMQDNQQKVKMNIKNEYNFVISKMNITSQFTIKAQLLRPLVVEFRVCTKFLWSLFSRIQSKYRKIRTRKKLRIWIFFVPWAINRGVATNSGLGGPGSNRDLFCIVSKNVVWKGLMFLHVLIIQDII